MRTEPVDRQVFAQPVFVMPFAGGRTDQPVAVGAEIRQCHLGNDAAAFGEEIVERGAASARHAAGHHVIEPRRGAGAGDLEFCEPWQVEYCDSFVHGGAFTSMAVCQRGRGTTPPGIFEILRVGEINRALPTAACAEACALGRKAQIGGRALGRAPAGRSSAG